MSTTSDNHNMRGSRARWVFAIATPIFGVIYWWFADWWAYVEFPEGSMPKFVMPWWFQFIVSTIFGAALGGILAGLWWVIWRSWRLWGCDAL